MIKLRKIGGEGAMDAGRSSGFSRHQTGLRAHVMVLPWFILAISSAQAHGDEQAGQSLLTQWPINPELLIVLLLSLVFFVRGTRHLQAKGVVTTRGQYWAFYAGLTAIFLALQTPLDLVAEHVFYVHQLQHLLLRGVAPLLLMLAVPAGPLIAGMPGVLRRSVLVPVMTHGGVRSAFRFLARPVVCTLLYIGSLYAWQFPAYHDAALLSAPLHYLMHMTMLLSGMLFFGCVFDPRPSPWGIPFSSRLIMLGSSIFANIPVGALTTLKTTVLYVAYDRLGRWWGMEPLVDELLGGLILWIPASMMGLLAVLFLVRLWGKAESKLDLRRQQGFASPIKGRNSASAAASDQARRRMAWSLAVLPVLMFAAVILLAVWMSQRTAPSLLHPVLTVPTSATGLSVTKLR
ncbi:MAG: cytochrome c oxidase assembly protein [Gammaproteobacteria bacterium]|nr:cytochrome c oxidase assembly protein [Gammaproteobacteria bacterium]MBU1786154.1 cytochrome c oxidase assembly protein [Gammaproteobacteria bacterium]